MEQERNLTPADELTRYPVSRHFDELPLDAICRLSPGAEPAAVARTRIPRIGVRLQHRSVRMEGEHMPGKRSLGRFHNPGPDDWRDSVTAGAKSPDSK